MKRENNNYDTLVGAIESLKKLGYTHNFRVTQNGLLVESKGNSYTADEVELNELQRFEGLTNPSDTSILYAVQTNSGERGLVVDSYGVNGSEATSKFMNRVAQKYFDSPNGS